MRNRVFQSRWIMPDKCSGSLWMSVQLDTSTDHQLELIIKKWSRLSWASNTFLTLSLFSIFRSKFAASKGKPRHKRFSCQCKLIVCLTLLSSYRPQWRWTYPECSRSPVGWQTLLLLWSILPATLIREERWLQANPTDTLHANLPAIQYRATVLQCAPLSHPPALEQSIVIMTRALHIVLTP